MKKLLVVMVLLALAACKEDPAAARTIGDGHIGVFTDSVAGVNCYHDRQGSHISCVKVK